MTAHADLAEVRAALALVAQATPGPWRTFGRWPNLAVVSGSGRPRIVASLASASDAVDDTPKDAAAIVALRNAAPAIAAAVEELTAARAEIAALNRQVCRLVSGQEIDGDRLCQHHGADVAALARLSTLEGKIGAVRALYTKARHDYATTDDDQSIAGHELVDAVADLLEAAAPRDRPKRDRATDVARYQAAAVAVATEIGGPLGPVDDDPEERAAAFVRFAEGLPGRVRERVEAVEVDLVMALHRERRVADESDERLRAMAELLIKDANNE